MAKTICREVCEVQVTDPTTGNEVGVTILLTEGGGMFGVDSSYLEQEVGPIRDPFDGRIVEIVEEE